MSDKLEIQNLGKEEKKTIVGNAHMPQPPFRLCLIGSSNSGKSNLIKNLLIRDEFGYSKHFGKNIFIISKTLLLDDTYADLSLPKTHMYKTWIPSIIEQIMDYSKKQENGVMLIIDDMISDAECFNKKQSNLLTTLFYMGRHYGISLIITSQKFHGIPSSMLSNASHMILFRLKTQREIDSFYDSITMYDNLKERYIEATQERYSFAYLNLSTGKFYKRFVQEL
jgi:GTP-binding protein EngB required for normal cell division